MAGAAEKIAAFLITVAATLPVAAQTRDEARAALESGAAEGALRQVWSRSGNAKVDALFAQKGRFT